MNIKSTAAGFVRTALCVFAAASLMTGTAFADNYGEEVGRELLYEGGIELKRLDLPGDAGKLVTVEAEGLKAKVSMFDIEQSESGERSFELIMTTDEGFIGRKGMGKTVEGDEKTPCGLFKMNTPFGISDLKEGFPNNYLKVDDTHYWNGDSASPLYNRMVSTRDYTDFNRSRSEHLVDYRGYYNYCIDTGYNPEGTGGLGSAIFLHCSMGINTGGCIAIPETDMVTALRNYEEGATYILLDVKEGFEKYYKSVEEEKSESVTESSFEEEAPEKDDAPRVIYAPSASGKND